MKHFVALQKIYTMMMVQTYFSYAESSNHSEGKRLPCDEELSSHESISIHA